MEAGKIGKNPPPHRMEVIRENLKQIQANMKIFRANMKKIP